MGNILDKLVSDSAKYNFDIIRIQISEDENTGTAIVETNGVPEALDYNREKDKWE